MLRAQDSPQTVHNETMGHLEETATICASVRDGLVLGGRCSRRAAPSSGRGCSWRTLSNGCAGSGVASAAALHDLLQLEFGVDVVRTLSGWWPAFVQTTFVPLAYDVYRLPNDATDGAVTRCELRATRSTPRQPVPRRRPRRIRARVRTRAKARARPAGPRSAPCRGRRRRRPRPLHTPSGGRGHRLHRVPVRRRRAHRRARRRGRQRPHHGERAHPPVRAAVLPAARWRDDRERPRADGRGKGGHRRQRRADAPRLRVAHQARSGGGPTVARRDHSRGPCVRAPIGPRLRRGAVGDVPHRLVPDDDEPRPLVHQAPSAPTARRAEQRHP